MAKLSITLDRGYSKRTQRQIATLRGLGLTKREKTVELEDTAAIRGMVAKVAHLVTVNELDAAESTQGDN